MRQPFRIERKGYVNRQIGQILNNQIDDFNQNILVKVSRVISPKYVKQTMTSYENGVDLYNQIQQTNTDGLNIGYDENFKHCTSIKMFLDIDTPNNDVLINIQDIEYYFRLLLTDITEYDKIRIIVLQSSDGSNKYRMYSNIAAPPKLCKEIAENLKILLFKNNINGEYIDSAPYLSGSLRVPQSYKVSLKDKTTQKRFYPVRSVEEFTKCLIQNVQDCFAITDYGYFNPIVYFAIESTPSNVIPQEILTKFEELKIKEYTLVKKEKYLDIRIQSEHVCPITGEVHSSIGMSLYTYPEMYALFCYSDKCRGKSFKVLRENITEGKASEVRKAMNVNDIEYTHNQKYLVKKQPTDDDTVDIGKMSLTFIKSNMGTGKTDLMTNYILPKKGTGQNVLIVSFRRTFSTSLAQTYEAKNYMDESGQLHFNNNTDRIIIQIESINRVVNYQEINVLVLDEIESILSHIASIYRSDTVLSAIDKLIEILQLPKIRIVCMDASLRSETVQLISKLSHKSMYKIINNKSQHYEGNTVKIIPYIGQQQRKEIVDKILSQLKSGLKVVVHCSSKKITKTLYEAAQEQKYLVKMYHGDNYDTDTISKYGINMKEAKEKDFKNINAAIKDVQLLVFTGTMTAGVDIQVQFDTFTHIFTGKDETPDAFIQACFRVRHLKNKIHTMYISGNRQANFPESPSKAEKRCNDLYDKVTRLKKQLKRNYQLLYISLARANNIRLNGVEIIKGTLLNMGFNIIDDETTLNTEINSKKYKEESKKLYTPSKIQYELVDPDPQLFKLLTDVKQDKNNLIDNINKDIEPIVERFKEDNPLAEPEEIQVYEREQHIKRLAHISEQFHLWSVLIKGYFVRDCELNQYREANKDDRITILKRIKAMRNIRDLFGDHSLGKNDIFNIISLDLLTLDRVYEQFKLAIIKTDMMAKTKKTEKIVVLDVQLYR